MISDKKKSELLARLRQLVQDCVEQDVQRSDIEDCVEQALGCNHYGYDGYDYCTHCQSSLDSTTVKCLQKELGEKELERLRKCHYNLDAQVVNVAGRLVPLDDERTKKKENSV